MIETIDNMIQLLATGICSGIAFHRAYITQQRVWIKLGLSSFVFFLGDLYSVLYLWFYDRTPHYSNIPYVGWYASYLFLFLLLSDMQNENKRVYRHRALWLIPVFTLGMCIFYMWVSEWSSTVDNLTHCIVMTLLLWRAVVGFLEIRRNPVSAAGQRRLYITVLILCVAEYATSTVSCFWMGDTLSNPYFWFDLLLSATYLLMPAALKKAVPA